MLFWDNWDFCRDFLKKNWISRTYCPFWSQFWSTKCKQKRLGTKIAIEIFVKIHYFLVEIEKKIEKSTKITKNHKNLDKSRPRSRSTGLDMIIVETKTFETGSLPVLRSRVSLETGWRQIKTPRLINKSRLG
jgi:hypothetical protein